MFRFLFFQEQEDNLNILSLHICIIFRQKMMILIFLLAKEKEDTHVLGTFNLAGYKPCVLIDTGATISSCE